MARPARPVLWLKDIVRDWRDEAKSFSLPARVSCAHFIFSLVGLLKEICDLSAYIPSPAFLLPP